MNQLAGMLHSLCCNRTHSEDMTNVMNPDDSDCHYYLEQTIEDPWGERDHVLWVNESRTFMADLNTESPQEALDILRKVMNVVRAATMLLEEYPSAQAMLIKLLS